MKITNLEKTIGNFHLEVDDLYIEPGNCLLYTSYEIMVSLILYG